MATLGNYFYDGNSFALASVLCLDSQLQTTAPDGWYSQGGIYRQMEAGLLGTVQNCVSCIYGCNSQAVSNSGSSALYGQFKLVVDVGTGSGAVLAEFFVSNNSAVRCTWTYSGLSASEYSSPVQGYCEGLIGDENITGITNSTGSGGSSYVGTNYNYQNGQWVGGGSPTWGPYSNQTSGGVTLFPGGNFGTSIMVIPKPNSSPNTIEFVMDMPSGSGTNDWDFTLKVNCPNGLIPLNVDSNSGIDCQDACQNTLNPQVIYRAIVSGTVPMPAVNDWVFSDANGVIEWADGFWRVVVNGANYCMTTQNSVITNFTPC